MLWNRQDEETTGPYCAVEAMEHSDIVINVLEDVERSRDVKCRLVGHCSGVELDEVGFRDSFSGKFEPLAE